MSNFERGAGAPWLRSHKTLELLAWYVGAKTHTYMRDFA
jgi:hypothetical protein